MSEMVERVARAICHDSPLYAEFDEIMASDRYSIMRTARAAIAAMREPTEGMECAGDLRMNDANSSWVWQAMIDAAL